MKYLRLSTDFFKSEKKQKLISRVGFEGSWALLKLWTYVAHEKPDGILSGMNKDDVELAAEWNGKPGLLVSALVELGWIDVAEDGTLSLHGWEEHNSISGICK